MLQILVGPLCLTVALRINPQGKTYSHPQITTKLFPKFGPKLGSPVRDHIHQEAMKAKDVVNDSNRCLSGKR